MLIADLNDRTGMLLDYMENGEDDYLVNVVLRYRLETTVTKQLTNMDKSLLIYAKHLTYKY